MKMNNKLKGLFLIASFGLVLTGCEYDQDYPAAHKPVATISPLSLTAAEGDTVTFTVTLNEPIAETATFKLETVETESTALEIEDFNTALPVYPEFDFGQAGYQVNLQPLVTEYSFDVIISEDILADNSESVTLKFVSAGTALATVQDNRQDIVIDITNTEAYDTFTGDDMGVKLDWSSIASFPYINDEGERELEEDFDLGGLDFDVLIELPDGTIQYLAGTANCPEVGVLSSTSPNGTYKILVDYYDDAGFNNVIAPVPVPMDLTISNIGRADGTTSFPDLYDISDATSADEGGTPIEIATIEKTDTSYTGTNSITGEVFYP